MNNLSEGSYPEIEGAVAILDELFRNGSIEGDSKKMVRIFIAGTRFEIIDDAEYDDDHNSGQETDTPQKFVTLPLDKARLNLFLEYLRIPRRDISQALEDGIDS